MLYREDQMSVAKSFDKRYKSTFVYPMDNFDDKIQSSTFQVKNSNDKGIFIVFYFLFKNVFIKFNRSKFIFYC